MLRAADRYDSDRPGLGDQFLDVIERAVDDIASAPLRWRLVDGRHRRRVVKRFPYSIYYRLIESAVVIVAIAHHKRAPEYWRSR